MRRNRSECLAETTRHNKNSSSVFLDNGGSAPSSDFGGVRQLFNTPEALAELFKQWEKLDQDGEASCTGEEHCDESVLDPSLSNIYDAYRSVRLMLFTTFLGTNNSKMIFKRIVRSLFIAHWRKIATY